MPANKRVAEVELCSSELRRKGQFLAWLWSGTGIKQSRSTIKYLVLTKSCFRSWFLEWNWSSKYESWLLSRPLWSGQNFPLPRLLWCRCWSYHQWSPTRNRQWRLNQRSEETQASEHILWSSLRVLSSVKTKKEASSDRLHLWLNSTTKIPEEVSQLQL